VLRRLQCPLRVGSGRPLDELDLPRPIKIEANGYPEGVLP
jgi:hypothetical protein